MTRRARKPAVAVAVAVAAAAPALAWDGHHLYREWPDTRRKRRYLGSIVRLNPPWRWAAWARDELYLGSFNAQYDARDALETHARGEEP